MATIDMTYGDGTTETHVSRRTAKMPYSVERVIDFAEVTTTKGSAIATGDVIQIVDVPPNTLLHGAVAELVTATDSTTATINIDVGGGDDFVDGGNIAAGQSAGWLSPGTNGLYPFGANTVGPLLSTTDQVDMTIATMGTDPITTGKVRVVVHMSDVSEIPGPANADRDQLA